MKALVTKSVSQSVSQSIEILLNKKILKFYITLVEEFMIDLKTFLSLATPSLDIIKEILSWFCGERYV